MLDIVGLLLQIEQNKEGSRPKEWKQKNRKRTSSCPALEEYVEFCQKGWSGEVKSHASSCRFCQLMLALFWRGSCPRDTVLKDYLKDPEKYIDRLAVEWHIGPYMGDCKSCQAKLKHFSKS